MYWRRVLRRAWSDLRQFWSAPRIWAAISTAVAIIVLHLLSNGWRWPTDKSEAISTSLFGVLLAVAGTFIYMLLRAPALLDADMKQGHEEEVQRIKNAATQEEQRHMAAEQEMRRQFEVPEIVPEILRYELQEVARPLESPSKVTNQVIKDLGFTRTDTIARLSIRIRNDHRARATVTGYEVWVREKRTGLANKASEPDIDEIRSYPRIVLDSPIEYACPHSGWLFFRFFEKSRADLAGGELSFSVTDGAGKVSATAVRIG